MAEYIVDTTNGFCAWGDPLEEAEHGKGQDQARKDS